jgi:hypothetical protein
MHAHICLVKLEINIQILAKLLKYSWVLKLGFVVVGSIFLY